MTENNKPEWIVMAEADGKPEFRKVSNTLPIRALLAVALILGGGAVIGQTRNETPASAVTAGVSQDSNVKPSPESTSQSVTPTTAAVNAGTVAANKLTNPSIAQLPTGRDVEERGEGQLGRGHHEDDHHDGDDD